MRSRALSAPSNLASALIGAVALASLSSCTHETNTPPACMRKTVKAGAQGLRDLRIEDVTGDGIGDIALLQEDGHLLISDGLPDGDFAAPRKIPAGPTPRNLAFADIDKDGVLDALIVGHFSDALTVLLGAGGGEFRPGVSYSVGNHSQKLHLADLDADGNLDVVTKNAGSRGFFNITVLMGRGDGTFAPAMPYPTTGLPRDSEVADIDSDGNPDVLVAITNANVIDIFLGRADGSLSAPTQLALSADPLQLKALDVNGDSLPDLVVSHGLESPGHLSVHLNLGSGRFAAERRIELGSVDAFVGMDLDRDGALDLIAATHEGRILAARGHGNGAFTPTTVPIHEGDWPTTLAVGSLDGDEYPDLAWLTSNGEVEIAYDVEDCGN